jgi:siroheme synthase
VVLYMASRHTDAISSGLIAAGVSAARPAVLVENASLPDRRILPTRVGDLAAAVADLGDGPALLVIGDVYAAIVAAHERARAQHDRLSA